MRAFIAIDLPQATKYALAGLQDQLREAEADVKWVAPQNIHLTLKFLGEINAGQVSKISAIIEDVASDNPDFTLRINSLGAFPRIDYLRVIWVGLDKGDAQIKKIARELEEKIEKIGIPKEDRPFSSHITIARTRSNKNRQKLILDLKKLSEGFKLDDSEFKAGKITLFKSDLSPKGPTYEVLKSANLKTT